MLRKQQRFRGTRVGVSLALILSAFSLAAPAQGALVQAKGNPHCTAQAQSTDTPIEVATPKGFECFPTFAQAVMAATAGRVQLPPSAQPADLTDEILSTPHRPQRNTEGISPLGVSPSPNNTVIGIDYDGVDYSSTSLTWYVDNYMVVETIVVTTSIPCRAAGTMLFPRRWDMQGVGALPTGIMLTVEVRQRTAASVVTRWMY
jgi:hypothetical protein